VKSGATKAKSKFTENLLTNIILIGLVIFICVIMVQSGDSVHQNVFIPLINWIKSLPYIGPAVAYLESQFVINYVMLGSFLICACVGLFSGAFIKTKYDNYVSPGSAATKAAEKEAKKVQDELQAAKTKAELEAKKAADYKSQVAELTKKAEKLAKPVAETAKPVAETTATT